MYISFEAVSFVFKCLHYYQHFNVLVLYTSRINLPLFSTVVPAIIFVFLSLQNVKRKLKNNNIIHVKADKGNGLVLINKNEYINKTL